jgi:hypothetical protein
MTTTAMPMVTMTATDHSACRPVRPASGYVRGLPATVWQDALRRNGARRPATVMPAVP